jgi:hypothetical protein
VLAVRKKFVSHGENSFLTFWVEYLLEVARHLVRLSNALKLFSNHIRVYPYIHGM